MQPADRQTAMSSQTRSSTLSALLAVWSKILEFLSFHSLQCTVHENSNSVEVAPHSLGHAGLSLEPPILNAAKPVIRRGEESPKPRLEQSPELLRESAVHKQVCTVLELGQTEGTGSVSRPTSAKKVVRCQAFAMDRQPHEELAPWGSLRPPDWFVACKTHISHEEQPVRATDREFLLLGKLPDCPIPRTWHKIGGLHYIPD